MLKRDAIKTFLSFQPYEVGKLYTPSMEVQVNVARDKGEPIEGTTKEGRSWRGFTDNVITWRSFRIPFNAGSEPTYKDTNIGFPIDRHAEAIGLTGWDFENKVSRWVAFDFDSLIGHKVGLSNEQLTSIRELLSRIEWVTIYTSTGGLGYHVYIFIDNQTKINNHTEHAALARSILNKLSALSGIDLSAKVDTLGGNMWVWHRKAKPGISYQCLKKGNPLTELPDNWQQYINQVSKRTVQRDNLQDVLAAFNTVDLDEEHLKLIRWFENNKFRWWWDANKHLLVCHTHALKIAFKELELNGYFDTVAEGTHESDHNCFCIPGRDGSWTVKRFTKGTVETTNWFTDNSGYTTSYYNKPLSFGTAAKIAGGQETEKGYNFKTLNAAKEAFKGIGIEIEVPVGTDTRSTFVKVTQGKLVVSFESIDGDNFEGWAKEKSKWVKIFYAPDVNVDIELPDNLLRHVVIDNVELGWYVYTNTRWTEESRQNAVSVLISSGYKRSELDHILGRCITNNWTLSTTPFQLEYPGNRVWNKGAPQLTYVPERGMHPTWDLILDHCSQTLTQTIRSTEWCKDSNVLSGADYLLAWLSALVQEPEQPLPYLALYGPQNCGKSILHECVSLLFSGGVCRADQSLVSPAGFNAELLNSVLCVVEETDLSKSRNAELRIKDWVTSNRLSIHKKGATPYTVTNTTHWIQCTNDPSHIPVFPGDTRITLIRVGSIKNEIPKHALIKQCKEEAPAFTYTLLNYELPYQTGRLRIPVITTEEKKQVQEDNESLLETFIEDKLREVTDGTSILFEELYERFFETLSSMEKGSWPKKKVARELPYQRGKNGKGETVIYGVTWRI